MDPELINSDEPLKVTAREFARMPVDIRSDLVVEHLLDHYFEDYGDWRGEAPSATPEMLEAV